MGTQLSLKKGTAPPLFGSYVYCGHGRPSQLLLSCCCTAHGKCRRVHWRHLANTTEVVHTGATWRIRLNICFLGPTHTQTTNRSVQPLLHSSLQKVPIFTMGVPFNQNCPFPLGIWTPYNSCPWASPSPQPKRHLDRFSRFCTDDRGVSLSLYITMGHPFSPSKLLLPIGGSGPPSNTWFSGPTRVINPNGISIGAAVFVWLTSVTDRQTTLLGR